MTQGFFAGFERVLIWYYDSNGYATGQSNPLANGSTSYAYVCVAPKTAGLTPNNVTNLPITGGDKRFTTIQFGNPILDGFDLILSDFDSALSDMVSGSTRNTTNPNLEIVSVNPNRTSPRAFGLAFQQRYQLLTGASIYHTTIIPRAWVRLKKGQMAYQAESDTTLSVTPILGTIAPTGQVFGSTASIGMNLALELDRTDNYDYFTINPVHMTCFKGDGVATTFTNFYRPLSSVITLNATGNNLYKNGVPTALSSINTTTGVATLAAAGTAGDNYVLLYETGYVPV